MYELLNPIPSKNPPIIVKIKPMILVRILSPNLVSFPLCLIHLRYVPLLRSYALDNI